MTNTLDPPLSVIESWPKPNYVDPPTRGPGLLIISSILCGLGFIVIICRLYARLIITRALGSDDVLATFAYAWALAATVLVMFGNVHYGDGTHIWDVRPTLFRPHRLNVWWSELSYVVASCCIRISVQLFYRRLSVNFTQTFLWATWIGIIYNVLYMVGCFLTLLLLCHPIDAYWNRYDPSWVSTHKYHCAAENVSLPLFAAISLVGDLYATCVPLALIASIPRSYKEKIALYFLFSLGFFVVAAAGVRLYYNYELMNVDYDFTWILFDTWIWTEVELYLAIYAASAPALKPFFQRVVAQTITKSWARSRTAVSSATSSAAIVVKRASTRKSKPAFLLNTYVPPTLEHSVSLERKHDMLIENQLEYWSMRERESYPHAYSNSTEKHMSSIEVRQQLDRRHLDFVTEEEETLGSKEFMPFSSLNHSPV